MTNTLIIPSAWEPQNALFPGVYDLMVPINWKPTINYILENISQWQIKKVIILLNKNDNSTRNYNWKCGIKISLRDYYFCK